jgi:hypothetical protein
MSKGPCNEFGCADTQINGVWCYQDKFGDYICATPLIGGTCPGDLTVDTEVQAVFESYLPKFPDLSGWRPCKGKVNNGDQIDPNWKSKCIQAGYKWIAKMGVLFGPGEFEKNGAFNLNNNYDTGVTSDRYVTACNAACTGGGCDDTRINTVWSSMEDVYNQWNQIYSTDRSQALAISDCMRNALLDVEGKNNIDAAGTIVGNLGVPGTSANPQSLPDWWKMTFDSCKACNYAYSADPAERSKCLVPIYVVNNTLAEGLIINCDTAPGNPDCIASKAKQAAEWNTPFKDLIPANLNCQNSPWLPVCVNNLANQIKNGVIWASNEASKEYSYEVAACAQNANLPYCTPVSHDHDTWWDEFYAEMQKWWTDLLLTPKDLEYIILLSLPVGYFSYSYERPRYLLYYLAYFLLIPNIKLSLRELLSYLASKFDSINAAVPIAFGGVAITTVATLVEYLVLGTLGAEVEGFTLLGGLAGTAAISGIVYGLSQIPGDPFGFSSNSIGDKIYSALNYVILNFPCICGN